MTDHMLTIDQQLALKSAAVRLAEQFEGVFGTETVERFLTSSYDQFATRATAVNFLPVMAERFARQRLKALAASKARRMTACPRCCSSACTTRADRRWPSGGSSISPVTEQWRGRAAPSPAMKSIRRRSRR